MQKQSGTKNAKIIGTRGCNSLFIQHIGVGYFLSYYSLFHCKVISFSPCSITVRRANPACSDPFDKMSVAKLVEHRYKLTIKILLLLYFLCLTACVFAKRRISKYNTFNQVQISIDAPHLS
jgi:hypothetical protein